MNIEPINDSSFETELLGGSSANEPYRMRCPNCRKLYSVEPKLLGASESALSKFECVDCQTAFFAMKPEFHGAHFLQTQMLETQFAPFSHQPNFSPNERTLNEAVTAFDLDRSSDISEFARQVRASVIPIQTVTGAETLFARETGRTVAKDLELAESAELVALWQGVTDDYQNAARHELFIAKSHELQRLTYASHKYAQILVVTPQDELARRMRNRVIGLVSYGFDATTNGLSKVTWQFPLPSFNSFIILLGAILVMVGFGFPHARQTAGLGFAMIALALGLRFFLRRPRN